MLAALGAEPETCEYRQDPIDIRAFTHQNAIRIAPRHQKPLTVNGDASSLSRRTQILSISRPSACGTAASLPSGRTLSYVWRQRRRSPRRSVKSKAPVSPVRKTPPSGSRLWGEQYSNLHALQMLSDSSRPASAMRSSGSNGHLCNHLFSRAYGPEG
jgi:hypothetical protein